MRAILEPRVGNAGKKDLDHIKEVGRALIAHAPQVTISTAGADCWHDISPKGDAPGFVEGADDAEARLRPQGQRLSAPRARAHARSTRTEPTE